jgi:hypothetical protein
MAIASLGSLITGQSKTSGVSLVVATSSTLSVGQIGVIVFSMDNQSTTLNSTDVTAVTDAAGNVWRKLGERTQNISGNNTGVTTALFYTRCTTQLNIGANITVAHTTATARAISGWRFSADALGLLFVSGNGVGATNATGSGSIALSSLTSREYLFIRATGAETPNTNTYSVSTDYTEFTHTSSGTTGSTDDTNISVRGEFRIATDTSNTTSPSWSSAADQSSVMVAMRELPLYLGAVSGLSTTFVTGAGVAFDDIRTLNTGGVNAGVISGFTVNSINPRSITFSNRVLVTGSVAELTVEKYSILQVQITNDDNLEGALHSQSGGKLIFRDCNLTLSKLRYDWAATNYSNSNKALLAPLDNSSELEIYNSGLLFLNSTAVNAGVETSGILPGQMFFRASRIEDSVVRAEDLANTVLVPMPSSVFTNSYLPNIDFYADIVSYPVFSEIKLNKITIGDDPTVIGTIDVKNSTFFSPENYYGSYGDGVGFHFINTSIDLEDNTSIYDVIAGHQPSRATTSKKFWTVDLLIADSNGPIENVLVSFENDSDSFWDESDTSDGAGLVTFQLLDSEQIAENLPTDTGGYSSDAQLDVAVRQDYTRTIKSYLHLASEAAYTNNAQLGSSENPVTFGLLIDVGVTETNTTTVSAYSGITNATGSITLSGTLTLSQIYDSRKLYWRNNDSVSTPTQQGAIADFGSANITISAGSNSPATTAKYQQFTTTGDITLSAAGTYLNGHVPATGEVIVVAGETILAGWTFASGATISRVSGSATVFVDASQLANITPGTGVTLSSTPVLFEGFPTGNNANGVAYAAVIAILNTDDDTLFAAYTGGATYSKSLSTIGNGVGPFQVWGDGVGLRRTIAQTITAARTEPVSLDGLFQEFEAEDGTVLVGLAAADTGVTYDQANTRFEFSSASHQFLGILHQFDALTSTTAGQAYDNTAVRGITFISNDAYKRILLPSAFTISATESAATAPLITDCLVLNDDGTDAREFGLSSTLYDERPVLQFAFQVAGSVSVDAQDIADALKLAPAAGTPAAGSVYNLLDGIPTTAEFEARTLPSASYFDPAADTVTNVTTVGTVTNPVTAGTVSDKTGYGLSDNAITTAKIQDGSLTAAKFASGAFDAVWAVATRTLTSISDSSGVTTLLSRIGSALAIDGSGNVTAGNMRGTDNALLAASYTTPPTAADNAGAVRTELSTELGRIDATISSRLADSDYAIPANFTSLLITEAGLVTSSNAGSGATAQQVWEYSTRTLTSGGGGDDAATIYNYFTDGTRANAFKATGFSTLTSGDIATALTTYTVPTLAQVEAAGFTTTRHNALIAADLAARALADGRYDIDYTLSTATQYNPDGTVRTVFDLEDPDGNPATSGQTAVKRVPQ